MLQKTYSMQPAGHTAVPARTELSLSVRDVLEFAQRQWVFVTLVTTVFLCCGLSYVITVPKLYSASTVLLIETRKMQSVQPRQSEDGPADAFSVASQAEVMKSEKIANKVIDDLQLLEDPEFVDTDPTIFQSILGLFASPGEEEEASQATLRHAVLTSFLNSIWISRVGSTYVFEIRFTSTRPEKAARIANAIADAYIADSLEVKIEAGRRLAEWLQERLGELSSQVETAELAVAEFKAKTNISNHERVQLRDLEGSAQAYRALHDSLLQRLRQVQQAFPVSDMRVITEASAPLGKSSPKTRLIIGVAGLLGMVLGISTAFIREKLENGFRSRKEVETIAGLECLGLIPLVPSCRTTHPDYSAVGEKIIRNEPEILRHVVGQPFSFFAETIRSVKVSIDFAGPESQSRIVGIISALPGEGKTTVCSNLAQIIADSGARVLLIDGDFRNPTLSRSLAPGAECGLLEVISQTVRLQDVMWTDAATGLNLLPAVMPAQVKHTSEVVSSTAMEEFLKVVQKRYDYILVDLPPLCAAVDAKAASHLFDCFVWIIRWRTTSRDAVLEAIHSAPSVFEKAIGTVLVGPTFAELKRAESYKGRQFREYYKA